jgi:hypothetical protein
MAEIEALDPRLFPVTRKLGPVFANDERDRVFEILLGSFLDGIKRALTAQKS